MKENGFPNVFVASFLAGICIALGGMINLLVDNKYLGAFLFSIGLFCVCTGGLWLYTGKICYVFFFKGNNPILLMFTILVGNAVGTALIGYIIRLTRNATIMDKAKSIMEVKLNDSPCSLFLLGVLCNVFIFIAVEGFNNLKDVGKYLAIIFGVMGFILSGTEHCIADFFYFFASGLPGNIDVVFTFFMIILGNTVGGILSFLLIEFLKEG